MPPAGSGKSQIWEVAEAPRALPAPPPHAHFTQGVTPLLPPSRLGKNPSNPGSLVFFQGKGSTTRMPSRGTNTPGNAALKTRQKRRMGWRVFFWDNVSHPTSSSSAPALLAGAWGNEELSCASQISLQCHIHPAWAGASVNMFGSLWPFL